MEEIIITASIGFIATVLSSLVSFAFGQRAERQKQSLLIKAEMLKPIDDWLKGVEKIVTIFSYTTVSITQNLREPIGFDLAERKSALDFISEKSNEVLGIIESKSLHTRKSKKAAKELSETIVELHRLIIYEVFRKENEIVELSSKGKLLNKHILDAGSLKLRLDFLLKKAYSLEAQVKTALT